MEEKELKKLLSTTKVKADGNLKDRIVHQINAERELIPTKRKVYNTEFSSHLSILGIMYVMLLILAGYFYQRTDGNLFQSTSFITSALCIASIFSIYWLITVYVDYKKLKGISK